MVLNGYVGKENAVSGLFQQEQQKPSFKHGEQEEVVIQDVVVEDHLLHPQVLMQNYIWMLHLVINIQCVLVVVVKDFVVVTNAQDTGV